MIEPSRPSSTSQAKFSRKFRYPFADFGEFDISVNMRQTCIFSGSSHLKLVDAICERLGKQPDKVQLRKFSNGETSVEISQSTHLHPHVLVLTCTTETSVRDQDVFIVQSGSGK